MPIIHQPSDSGHFGLTAEIGERLCWQSWKTLSFEWRIAGYFRGDRRPPSGAKTFGDLSGRTVDSQFLSPN